MLYENIHFCCVFFRMASHGRTIIMSIHQPRYSIYRLFDTLTLLVSGKMVYHGPAPNALDYFANIGDYVWMCYLHKILSNMIYMRVYFIVPCVEGEKVCPVIVMPSVQHWPSIWRFECILYMNYYELCSRLSLRTPQQPSWFLSGRYQWRLHCCHHDEGTWVWRYSSSNNKYF